ncbi:MAG: undecaprenyl-diphosphate phosphatase [Magnetococcales bacterium]|nr:undecaprenyl-diphosphate phosphatase [Magnetococcales bacterium]
MEWLQAVFLGLIQGITEFLPISSSGHLILAPYVFDWQDQGLIFDVAVNTGTLMAVIIYFRREIKDLIIGFVCSLQKGGLNNNPQGYLAWAVGFATIPVGIAGLLFKDHIETYLRHPHVVGAASIFFAIFLWLSDRNSSDTKTINKLTWRDAVIIGMGQVFALIPGASRAGMTMTAALFLGYNRESAAKFSFLMAIPVGVLAGGLEFLELINNKPSFAEWSYVAVGFVVAMISAMLVIHWLLDWVKSRNMTVFVVYRILLGAIIFIVVS